MKKRQVIIIGGGPGGAATALYLIQAGIKPLIIERQSFPRFHIGESLSGECGNSIRKLELDAELLAQNYPIKYGVNVYNPNGIPFWVEVKKRCPETNALVPNWTWSVTRSSFDKILLDAARSRGAEYMECEAVKPLQEKGRVMGLQIRTDAGALENLYCDCPRRLFGAGDLPRQSRCYRTEDKGGLCKSSRDLFQIEDMTLDAGTEPSKSLGNTLIFYKKRDHWAWTIPLTPRLVSVGVVAPAAYFKEQGLEKTEYLRREIMSLNPELTRRITKTSFVEEVRSVTSYSYSTTNYAGHG